MKRYKLVKDLPTFKAGDEFVLKDDGNLYLADLPGKGSCHWKGNVMAYHRNTLAHFPNILGEWFEEIEGGSWKPKHGDKFYKICDDGSVCDDEWMYFDEDEQAYAIGNCFKTREEANNAVKKLKAWKRLKDNGAKFNGWDVGSLLGTDYIGDGYIVGICGLDIGKRIEIEEDLDTLFGGE